MEFQLDKTEKAVNECLYLARKRSNDLAAGVTEHCYAYTHEAKVSAREKVLLAFEGIRDALSEMVALYRRAEPLTALAQELEDEAEAVLSRLNPATETATACEGTDNDE